MRCGAPGSIGKVLEVMVYIDRFLCYSSCRDAPFGFVLVQLDYTEGASFFQPLFQKGQTSGIVVGLRPTTILISVEFGGILYHALDAIQGMGEQLENHAGF